MDAANLLASLRKTNGDALHALLDDKVLSRLPSRTPLRERMTLRALILSAPDLEWWRGSLNELSEAVSTYALAGASSRVTVKRAIKGLCRRGFIQVDREDGLSSTYHVDWRVLMSLPEPSLFAGDEVTRVNPGQHSIGDPGQGHHPQVTRVTPKIPTIHACDPGHFDPGQALHGVGDGNISKAPSPSSIPALARAGDGDGTSKKSGKRGFLWGRNLEVSELRDVNALHALFEQVVEAGFAMDSDGEFRTFIALVIYSLRQRAPVGFLTACLSGRCQDKWQRTDWRTRPTNGDRDAAKSIEARLRGTAAPRQDGYVSQLQEANDERRAMDRKRRELQEALREKYPRAFSTARSPVPGGGVR